MSYRYILDAKKPVECEDLLTWAKWFETANRHVAVEERDGVRVSTVFLGHDHRFGGDGPPILFETMIFGGPNDQDQDWYSTWEEAEAGHAAMCAKAFQPNAGAVPRRDSDVGTSPLLAVSESGKA
jgi:hypothetical protein